MKARCEPCGRLLFDRVPDAQCAVKLECALRAYQAAITLAKLAVETEWAERWGML